LLANGHVFPFVLKAALTGKFMANAHGTFSTWWQQEKLMRSFDNFPFSLVACSSSSTTASIDKTQQLQQQKFQTWLLHNAAAEEFHPIKGAQMVQLLCLELTQTQ